LQQQPESLEEQDALLVSLDTRASAADYGPNPFDWGRTRRKIRAARARRVDELRRIVTYSQEQDRRYNEPMALAVALQREELEKREWWLKKQEELARDYPFYIPVYFIWSR
jgi:hypothetical protein